MSPQVSLDLSIPTPKYSVPAVGTQHLVLQLSVTGDEAETYFTTSAGGDEAQLIRRPSLTFVSHKSYGHHPEIIARVGADL